MKQKYTLGAYLRRSLLFTTTLSGFVLLVHTLGWLSPIEMAVEDSVRLFRTPHLDRDVVSVTIDEEIFQSFFGGHSPLDPLALKQLLCAIAAGGPKIIAVDLETRNWKRDDVLGLPPVPIIWARSADLSKEPIIPMPVLGGAIPLQSMNAGLALFPEDRDGRIRRYHRTREINREITVPSLPWAIYGALNNLSPEQILHVETNEIGLNYTHDFIEVPNLPASAVLAAAHPTPPPGWLSNSPVRGKIVLLGGTYGPTHDSHQTPVGPRAGVQIIAQALSAEMNGTGINRVTPLMMWLTEIAVGLGLACVQYYNHGWKAILLTISAVVLMSVVASFLVYRTGALWPNFVPVLFAVFLHSDWEAVRDNADLRLENDRLRTELALATNSGG